MRPSCYGNFKNILIEDDEKEDCNECDYWSKCQTKTIKTYDLEEMEE